MRHLILALACLILIGSSSPAQQSAASNAYRRYARAILTKADSAASAMNVAMADSSDPAATVPQRLGKAGASTRRLAGDFDAVVPPSDLARLHAQLVEPLKALAARLEKIAGLYGATCESAGLGSSCDQVSLRVAASRRAQAEVEGLPGHALAYLEARSRAARMLKDHGVDLPEIK